MSTVQNSPPDSAPRPGLPRWAWILIALLAAIALVAVAVAVFGRQDRTVVLPAVPAPSRPTASLPSSTTPAPPSPPETLADGCLGGVLQLDEAVLAAQQQAPLTPAGAASFAATVARWAFSSPSPAGQVPTAKQILAADATDAARHSLSSSSDLQGSGGALDFTGGKYYIEFFDGRSATVSYLASSNPTLDGVPQGQVTLAGTAHLVAVNGTWRYQDLTTSLSIADLQRIGVPYSGGC